MSIKQKINGKVSLVHIHASEVGMIDTNNNFKNKNVESALKELKEDKTSILNKLNDYVSYNKLPNSQDFNDCIQNGFYKTPGAMLNLDGRMFIGVNTLGLHEASTEGLLKVNNFSDLYIEQTFSSIYGFTVQRAKINGIWYEWNKLANIKDLPNSNLLINGGFQVWQRGNSFTNVTNQYTTDRWLIATDGKGSVNVEKTNLGVKITVNGDTAFVNYLQAIEKENIQRLIGKEVTLTFKTKEKNNIVNQIWCMQRSDPVKYYAGFPFNDGVLRDTFSVTFTIKEAQADIEVGIQLIGKKDNIVELEWAKLELGTVATPFVPKLYSEEELLCKRYYRIERLNCFPIGGQTGQLTNNLGIYNTFNPSMRTTPTVTLAGNNLFEISSIRDVKVNVTSVNVYTSFIGNFTTEESAVKQGLVYSGIFIIDAEIR